MLNLSYKGQKWTITAYNAGVNPPKSDVRVVAVTFYKFYSITVKLSLYSKQKVTKQFNNPKYWKQQTVITVQFRLYMHSLHEF